MHPCNPVVVSDEPSKREELEREKNERERERERDFFTAADDLALVAVASSVRRLMQPHCCCSYH
jgi:hypothetical protein